MTDHIDTAKERKKLAGLIGFTPGHWYEITPADNLWPPRVFAAGSKFVCMVDNSDDTQEQRIINARLIAAAPDLLALAHSLLDALDAKDAEIERLREATEYDANAANGMTAEVDLGDGAWATIIDPQSFTDGGPEWVMRYGNPCSIRFVAASLLESYDGLLSDHITTREAVRRLRLMRNARAALNKETNQ